MTAQPSEQPTGRPRKTLRGLRLQIPTDQLAAFEKALEALDFADLGEVAAFRDKWWARAVVAQDSELDADSDAALAGELALGTPWSLSGSR